MAPNLERIESNFERTNRKRVAIIGSGNWGSAIAKIIGQTTRNHQDTFNPIVNWWVRDQKLKEFINNEHENPKYLPGKKISKNVIAISDLVETCKDVDVLIFVIPHQFIAQVCQQLAGKLKKRAVAISLIKGLSINPTGQIKLISDEISEILGIEVAVLMGANLAHEVADEKFCEATIGTHNKENNGEMWFKLFNTDYFRITIVDDAHTVELCGALKNVVACAAGFADGLKIGENAKVALIRKGLMEIIKFIDNFYPVVRYETIFESCGIADLVTTCYGGRNRKVCEAYVSSNKTLAEVEKELLNGQSAQGPLTAEEIFVTLKSSNSLEK
uniref:Glycerol-3-phosphate dehydrogenase [NAD(+)] n=1 Tax=Acrobeloides nanus TaxID=290746 RepID=A0A914CDQ6_9BILA